MAVSRSNCGALFAYDVDEHPIEGKGHTEVIKNPEHSVAVQRTDYYCDVDCSFAEMQISEPEDYNTDLSHRSNNSTEYEYDPDNYGSVGDPK